MEEYCEPEDHSEPNLKMPVIAIIIFITLGTLYREFRNNTQRAVKATVLSKKIEFLPDTTFYPNNDTSPGDSLYHIETNVGHFYITGGDNLNRQPCGEIYEKLYVDSTYHLRLAGDDSRTKDYPTQIIGIE